MPNEPKVFAKAFSCPNCGATAQQSWFSSRNASEILSTITKHIYYDYRQSINDYGQRHVADFLEEFLPKLRPNLERFIPELFAIGTCESCSDITLWIGPDMVYPKTIPIEPPNDDLDDEIKDLYLEAASIFVESPKGAAALLRLALQHLLVQVGKPGKNINADIKQLVAEGLSPKIQRALDLLRVVGNNAVHPGVISLDDDSEIALKMFRVLNVIADELISKPNEIEQLYEDVVPEKTRQQIDARDGRADDI